MVVRRRWHWEACMRDAVLGQVTYGFSLLKTFSMIDSFAGATFFFGEATVGIDWFKNGQSFSHLSCQFLTE